MIPKTLTGADIAAFRTALLPYRGEAWAGEALRIVSRPGDYELMPYEARLLDHARAIRSDAA